MCQVLFLNILTDIEHCIRIDQQAMNAHRIHRVAKLTGLSKDVIRVWERRYGLVKPSRSSNRYREYSDEEVALLRFGMALFDRLHPGPMLLHLEQQARDDEAQEGHRDRRGAPVVKFAIQNVS